ncbi:NAD-dependent epimerase/dehydratase [Magnetococcus marinus MC-1]|uniref:NAD-dependent epimerase/dehydratase n=1 Tax=Magnetococcus marinus (strain ATCC BAA-1437 / JCM 17883 / MC-1) TaxID=156889 RepID=A0L596_MAGMM|nr:NAD(P)-dependent oxidoreductase [Magnetococcus marinus]ABK43139.1 NAD-dependent epimerase/dehydratase [Magnetococcus marinus MC-1]
MHAQLSILVTGGAGYLGSMLVPALLELGHKVTVVDNFMFQQDPLNTLCVNDHFSVVRGDVRNEALMRPLVAAADVIIPLAALVGAPLCSRDQVGATTTNKDAVITMLAWLSKEQRILMPITNSGYGIGQQDKFCTEESPLRPISLYGRDKVEVEEAILSHGNAISFRLATVFGMAPRMRLDLLVNDFVYRAVHDRAVVLFESHFKRNYIHIRDVAKVFIHGLHHFEQMKDKPYNVGLSDANLSKYELCERIQKQLPNFVFMEAPIGEDPDKRDYLVSNARIEATGWSPDYSLDQGIKELIKGYTMIRNTRYTNV